MSDGYLGHGRSFVGSNGHRSYPEEILGLQSTVQAMSTAELPKAGSEQLLKTVLLETGLMAHRSASAKDRIYRSNATGIARSMLSDRDAEIARKIALAASGDLCISLPDLFLSEPMAACSILGV